MDDVKVGRQLSYILRHQPDAAQIWLDEFGYAPVGRLISYLNITIADLDRIVEGNNKQRFSYNSDKTFIRANQGHSVKVNLCLESIEPPEMLYHGTASKNMKSLLINGIKKMQRHHVHLSDNVDTALSVGSRHGKPIILEVYAKGMYDRGMKFYKSENGVWLTDYVPTNYFMIR